MVKIILESGEDLEVALLSLENTDSLLANSVSTLIESLRTMNAVILDLNDRVSALENGNSPEPVGEYIWLSPDQIAALPESGDSFQKVMDTAESTVSPILCDQENQGEAVAVAAAVAYLKTSEVRFYDKVVDYLQQIINTEAATGCDRGGKLLALGRNLAGYVVAAQLIDYYEPTFVDWVATVINKPLWETTGAQTLIDAAIGPEAWPNNHGTAYRMSLLAAAHYLRNNKLVTASANKFQDWLGGSSTGFRWDAQVQEQQWHATYPDESGYVAVNPIGSTIIIDGKQYSTSGVLPEDIKRSNNGTPTYPFPRQNYIVESWAYALVTAHMLSQIGYNDVWGWQDAAILRGFQWLHSPNFPPHPSRTDQPYEYAFLPQDEGDPEHNWLINGIYGTDYPTKLGGPGKSGLGFWPWIYS